MYFEKKYWSNGEFTLSNGEKYFGYVGIYRGDAYIFDTEEKLIKSETFTSKINLSNKFFDRTLSHKLELPYKKEDVIFAANDFLHAGTVKTIVERLQENNMYLFRNAVIPNSILPINNSVSMFATKTVDKYFFSYIDADGNEQLANETAVFKNGYINIYTQDGLQPIGKAVYVINESYKGSIMDEMYYETAIESIGESGNELYDKLYRIKNTKFSRIPKITVVSDMKNGILSRHSFSDFALNSKTHLDPYFYPQREYKEYMSVKTIIGTWEDILSKNIVLQENKERDESANKFSDLRDLSTKEVYNLINDIDIDTDIDSTDDKNLIIQQFEKIKANLEDIETAKNNGFENKLQKSFKYYNKLSGDYKIIQWEPEYVNTIILTKEEFPDLYNIKKSTSEDNFNPSLNKISFLLKIKNEIEIPTLIVNDIEINDFTYAKSNNGFYYVTYYCDEKASFIKNNIKNEGEYYCEIRFSNLIDTVVNKDDTKNKKPSLKYTVTIAYGTNIPGNGSYDMRNYKHIPLVIRKRNFNWVWNNGEKQIIETLPTLTYKYLTESPEWINASGARLIMEDEDILEEVLGNKSKLISFMPSEDMTAEDCYNFMVNNLLSYRSFPKINRKTDYYYILKNGKEVSNIEDIDDINDIVYVANPFYKRIAYNTEIFIFDEKTNSIILSYKSACDAYRELNQDGRNNKKYFDYVPEFKTVTISESETTPIHDFTQLTNAEMQIIKRSEDGSYIEVLLMLMFKTKILITRVKHHINEKDNFLDNFSINLNESNKNIDYIEIDCVDPNNKNSLSFKHLNDIKLHKNMLYVADGELNMVLRYDIEYLISPEEDHSFDINSIKLLDILQGDGEINDKVYFNNPFAIAASDDRVYIVDRGNKCVKVYTPSLNYIKNLKNGYYATHDIQAVAVNPYPVTLEDGKEVGKDSLWIFSTLSKNLYLSIIDDDSVVSYGQIEDIHLLDDRYSWVEEFKNVEFSETNSNHYYIATTKRVYKLQTSKPYYPLGSLGYFKQRSLLNNMVWGRMHYRWTKLPKVYSLNDTNIENLNEVTWSYKAPMSSAEVLDNRCFTLCGLSSINDQFNGDLIFHLGTLYDDNKIIQYIKKNNYKFDNLMRFADIPAADLSPMIKSFNMLFYIEPDSYISSLNNNLINVYDINVNDITFEDYINKLTFNKMIYAVVYNLLTIKNQLIGSYKAASNLDGVIVYDNMLLDDYFSKLQFGNEADYFVHDNEVVSIVVNRIFEKIHNVQQLILDKMQTKFIAAQSYVNNTSRII